jgi:hypothetical protein
VCAVIRQWIDDADDEGRAQILEALQIAVRATPERAEVSGILPNDVSGYLPCNMHRDDYYASNNNV